MELGDRSRSAVGSLACLLQNDQPETVTLALLLQSSSKKQPAGGWIATRLAMAFPLSADKPT